MWPRPRMGMRPPPRPFVGGVGYGAQRPQFFNQNQNQNQNNGQRMPGPGMQQQRNDGQDGNDEMMPQDPMEAEKITNLQMQAQHWKQSKEQWEQQQEMQQKMEYAKQCTPAQLEAVIQEEMDFDRQYSEWKKQFSEWQDQNKNHPNQEQYKQYAQTWTDYEVQMEQKKSDIATRRAKLQEAMKLKNQMMAQQPMGPGPVHRPRMAPPVRAPMGTNNQGNIGGNINNQNFTPMNNMAPGMGPNMNQRNMGPRNFGPNPGQYGPNQGNFGPNQGNFGANQGNFGPNPGNFGPNQGNFGPNPRNFGPNPRNFGPNQGNFGPNQGNFGTNQGNSGPNQGNFGPNQGNFGANQGNFGPNQGNFGPNQGNFGPNQGNFGPNQSQGNFGPNQGNFGPNQGNFGPNQGNFGPNQGQANFGPNQGNFGPNTGQGNFGPNQGNIRPNQGNFGPNQGNFGQNLGNIRPNQGPVNSGPNQNRFVAPTPSPICAEPPSVNPPIIAEDELPPGTGPVLQPQTQTDHNESVEKTSEPGVMETTPAEETGDLAQEGDDDGLAEAIMAAMETGEEPAEGEEKPQREKIEAESWNEDVAERVRKVDEQTIVDTMKKNLEDDVKEKEKTDAKLGQQLADRDRRLAFAKAAETMRMIQEQQERIEQIKELHKLQKMAEKEQEEERQKEEEEKQRAEKRKSELEKKLSEKKSSQLQQQIEKALDRASGKSVTTGDEEKKDDKKIQIKVSILKENEKKDDNENPEKEDQKIGVDEKKEKIDEKKVEEMKEKEKEGKGEDKKDEKKAYRSYRRRSPVRSRSRSPARRRSRSPARRRSRSPHRRRTRSRSRTHRSRSRGRRSRSRSRSRGRRSRSPKRRRRSREKVDAFGRSLDIRRPYEEEKEKEKREEREKRESEKRPSPGRGQSRSRLDDLRRHPSVESRSSSRLNGGAKASLVPYDVEEDDRSRPDPYAPPRRDPYRAPARDPYSSGYGRDPYMNDPYLRERRDPYTDSAREAPRAGYRDLYERPPLSSSFDPLPRTPLYDRPPIDDGVRRLVYGRGPVYEIYAEQKYNREHSLFGDDEDEQAVFEYSHGRGKTPDDPYSDPDGSSLSSLRVEPVIEDYNRRSSVIDTYEDRYRDSPTDYGTSLGSTSYDYDPYPSRDPQSRTTMERSRESLTRSRGFDRYDESSRSPLPLGPSSLTGAPAPAAAPSVSAPIPAEEEKSEHVSVDELLLPPGRDRRPAKIVIIVRGAPGSGKTYVSKLIREREVTNGGAPPRMLCLDDYFMVETEKVTKDPETGRMSMAKVMEYEYESFMENSYRVSMLKSFKKTVDDGYFPFIIVDAVNNKIKQFEEFWSYANSKAFQVYVAELDTEPALCVKRNIHARTAKEINDIVKDWEELPPMFARVDVRPLLQDAAITDVEMTDYVDEPETEVDKEDEDETSEHKKSKWELDTSESKLDRLDGLSKRARHLTEQEKFDEYLQLPDDYDMRQNSLEPGRKRVRWADIEERKDQQRQRNLGFVVGHTNWDKIMDDDYADRALNRTKYF